SKRQLFEEIFRVLKKGGRAVISDIVSDEEVPEEMQNDPELWGRCISGAFTEDGLLAAFEESGFYGLQILRRNAEPWRTVQGTEFRSVTIEAFKGKQGECFERNQAVIYRGPFKEVLDDDNHRMERGKRYAVCDKTYNLYRKAPYDKFFEFVDPIVAISWATITTFAGSIMSIYLARTLLKKFIGKGIVPDYFAGSEYFLLSVAIGAGMTVIIATLTGFPISTTHALTGAIIGCGFVSTGPAMNFFSLGKGFVLSLLLSPVLAMAVAGLLYVIFHGARIALGLKKEWCVCVGEGERGI